MTTSTTFAAPPAAKAKSAKAGKPPPWRRRLDVAARGGAAIFLGYLFAALSTAVLARVLPGPRAEASMAATLLSFAVYASVAVWAFADAKTWRVWLGLIAGSGLLAEILWISLTLEPRL